MKMSNKYGAALLLLTVSGFLMAWMYWDEFAAPTIAPFQKTEEWNRWLKNLPKETSFNYTESGEEIAVENQPGIFIRVNNSNKRLFIKHSHNIEVYSYDPATKNIDRVTEDDWLSADGEITVCGHQMSGDYNTKVDVTDTWRDYTVKYNGHDLETYGQYALSATESPAHDKVAILSAYGPVKPSVPSPFFGLGGSEPVVYGRRYVQIVQLDTGKTLGVPVRLVSSDRIKNDRFCWSKDEKFIVIYKSFTNFSVIETSAFNQ